MGSRKRCLLPDLQPEGKLPVDDDAWVSQQNLNTIHNRAADTQLGPGRRQHGGQPLNVNTISFPAICIRKTMSSLNVSRTCDQLRTR
jgi:hypothetical protein